jgi:hypothetical protein
MVAALAGVGSYKPVVPVWPESPSAPWPPVVGRKRHLVVRHGVLGS